LAFSFTKFIAFIDTFWWNPLDEGEEESSMEECGLAEAR